MMRWLPARVTIQTLLLRDLLTALEHLQTVCQLYYAALFLASSITELVYIDGFYRIGQVKLLKKLQIPLNCNERSLFQDVVKGQFRVRL